MARVQRSLVLTPENLLKPALVMENLYRKTTVESSSGADR